MSREYYEHISKIMTDRSILILHMSRSPLGISTGKVNGYLIGVACQTLRDNYNYYCTFIKRWRYDKYVFITSTSSQG